MCFVSFLPPKPSQKIADHEHELMLNECMNVPFPAFSPTTPPESIFSSQHIFEPPCTCLYSPFTPAVHLHPIPPFPNRWMVISSPKAEAGGGGGEHNQLDTECERRAVNSGWCSPSPLLLFCTYVIVPHPPGAA